MADGASENGDTVGGVVRRISARILQKEKNKAAIRLRQQEEESLITKAEKSMMKNQRLNSSNNKRKGISKTQVVHEEQEQRSSVVASSISDRGGTEEHKEKLKDDEKRSEEIENGKGQAAGEKSAYAMVKDTIRLFYTHFLHFVQEEDKRCKKDDAAQKKENTSKSKDAGEEKGKAKRPDLKALAEMKRSNTILRPRNTIGSIPGVDVGHQFFSRCEMATVGYHNYWLSGIDYC